jgi:acetyltransferase-like isoleucine patch superfamily enzyme
MMPNQDLRGVLFKGIRILRLRIKSFFYTGLNYIICFIKDINIAKKCNFFGKTIFFRQPESIIQIGSACTFRSDKSSNLIGINRNCLLSTNTAKAKIIIGNNCGFSGTVIGSFKSVIIGNNVRCGANTLITDSDWHSDDPRSGSPKPVIIEDNVWLGVNAVVLKGVTIGKNTVIGANSVVTKNIPANIIAAGNPCRVIRPLTENELSTSN